MDYKVDGRTFSLSYAELREQYVLFCEMDDEKFLENLPAAIHFACVVCFLKETPTYLCLADTGIIHELAHQLHIGDMNLTPLSDIRELFKNTLNLAP